MSDDAPLSVDEIVRRAVRCLTSQPASPERDAIAARAISQIAAMLELSLAASLAVVDGRNVGRMR